MTINTTNGYTVILDDESAHFIKGRKIRVGNHGYAYVNRGGKRLLLHRLINNTPVGLFTDHINRNKLDNRKVNLRACSKSQNSQNRVAKITNTTGAVGVDFRKSKNKWRASVTINGKQKSLGNFICYKKAKEAAQNGRIKVFGEFACTCP